MNANWYDLLDVEPTSSPDEIRAAWRASVAELDPTDRRFRVFNQAAEVLLDPGRRAAYDAELAAEREQAEQSSGEPSHGEGSRAGHPHAEAPQAEDAHAEEGDATAEPAGSAVSAAGRDAGPSRKVPLVERWRGRRVPLVPGWAVLVLAGLLAASLVAVGLLLSKPSDAAVESDTEAAQAAAERAIVPVLSYDAHHLGQSQAAAEPFMTANEKAQYDKLFAVIKQNAPRTGTVVQAKYLASGIVRSGTDQVDVLVFVDQVTRNKQHPKVPVVYKNQVTVTMAKVGGDWLVDNLTTNGTTQG